MKKQFIAKLLVLVVALAMVPATVLAASAGSNSGYYSVSVDTTVSAEDTTVSAEDITVEDGAAVIEAKVVGGTASVSLNENAVESLADLAEEGEIVLEIKAEGATKIDVSLSAKALTTLAEETGADLTIKSDVAVITIPNEVLSGDIGTTGSVRISAQNTATSVSFSIQVSGKALNAKGIKVEF